MVPFFLYKLIQLVVPKAVKIAVAIDAMTCTTNFNVSFLVMVYLLSLLIAVTLVVIARWLAAAALVAAG